MTNPQHLIANALSSYDRLFEQMDQIITPERGFAYFKAVADIPAPSLTVSYTRGAVIRNLIATAHQKAMVGANLHVDINYLSTGNVVLSMGNQPQKPVWSMAHLDNISFLTGAYADGRYALTPFCDPRQTKGLRAAQALGYNHLLGSMTVLADGLLRFDGRSHFFETDVCDLPSATRIVYHSSAKWDRESGMVTGNIDNAFGCTALILAALVLSHGDVQSMLILTDEEEGVVVPGPAAFSRGASRLLNRIETNHFPSMITISDHHEEVEQLMAGQLDLSRFGAGALFGAFASGTKGGVTPPRLLAHQREMASYLVDYGIQLHENAGYISRSDCVTAMMATPNVSLIGYPGAYSHFIDTPRAHIDDLVSLAKTLVVAHLLAQDSEWRKAALG